ncbi:MAG: hypothetical protein FJX72_17990, partial [Armatimonadetes bacterium]|nr:hypothetical protein [Armatimonadota bacterium]
MAAASTGGAIGKHGAARLSPDATPFGPGRQVIQCAANVSEGRRLDVIARLAGSGAVEGAVVADVSSDADHNRTVISLLGDAGGLREAVCALAEACVAELDLGTHTGVHPRLGVLDVVPFTPMRHACMSECIRVSLEIGAEIARRTG